MKLSRTTHRALLPIALLSADAFTLSARSETPGSSEPPVAAEGEFEAKNDPLQPIKGARVPGAGEAEEEKKEAEWFGSGNPWWKWSRASGDWGGVRTQLEDKGVAFGLSYTFDGASVLEGGIRQRSVGRGLLDLNVTIDTEPLLGWKGGTFFGQYYFRHGRFGGEDVGDAQGYSNLDAERLSRAEEVWFEQKLLNEKLRVKIGQVDANAEFAFVEAAGDFINSSAGFSPTIGSMPTYPDPALSVNLFAYPTDQLYVGGGLYGKNFKELDSDSFDHPFLIGEIGFTHGGSGRFAAGRLAFGGWRDTGDIDRFDGDVDSGTGGFYVVAEQVVWKENVEEKEDAQGVSLFGQYGWADGEVNSFQQHVSLGASILGLIDGRDDDATGLRWSWVQLSDEPGSGHDANETNVEFFYKAQVTPFFSVKPGLQWIVNPGGVAAADNAVVATLRASIDF